MLHVTIDVKMMSNSRKRYIFFIGMIMNLKFDNQILFLSQISSSNSLLTIKIQINYLITLI